MNELFAQATVVDYSQWGVAGALLIFAAGFLAYLKHRDGEDRLERKEMSNKHEATIQSLVSDHRAAHDSCEETLKVVVGEHRECVNSMTDSYRLELATERDKRDVERKEFRESLHTVRNNLKTQ